MRWETLALIAATVFAVGVSDASAATEPSKPVNASLLSIVDVIPPVGKVLRSPVTVNVNATVQSLAEKVITVRYPTFSGIGLKQNDRTLWAGDLGVTVTMPPCKPPNCKIEANTTYAITVAVTGLSQPGKYEGPLYFLGVTGGSKEKRLEFWIRRPWWLAAFIIFLGASASMGIRWWFGSGQKVQLLRYKAARARETLKKLAEAADLDGDPAFGHLLTTLINEANQIEDEIGGLIPRTDDKRVDQFMRKTGLVRRWHAGKTLFLSASQSNSEIEATLQSFARDLAQPNHSDASLNELEAELGKIWDAIGEHLAAQAPAPSKNVIAMATLKSASEFDPITAFTGVVPRQQSSEWIAKHIVIVEGAILLFVLFVAILVGINQLWVPNLGWGSIAGILAALVWGLGLQLLGTNAIDSVLKLAGKP